MTNLLKLTQVTLRTREQILLSNFDLIARPADVVTLMGPSGCGKSSLLAWIGGVLHDGVQAEGSLSLNGRSLDRLPPEKRRLGILFQDDMLFPHLDVLGNLLFAIPRSTDKRHERAMTALAEVGMADLARRQSSLLSGGQKARVALIRALLAEPLALLLDEPFSALDQGLRAEIRAFVFALVRERQLPVLLVTHDPDDAKAAGGPILRPWG